MPLEIETKLIITGDEPAGLLDEIASLNGIGPFSFVHKRTLVLRDTYYDTQAQSLSSQGIALRTREKSGSTLICIKRNEHVDDHGAAIREELELPISEQNIPQIIQALKELPLSIERLRLRIDAMRESLKDIGLIPIQDRQTQRTTQDITSSLKPGKIIAELALDTVSYIIGGGKVLHFEIEVEAAEAEYHPLIVDLTDLLKQAYPDRLRRWDHNKLVTGFALEKLYALGKLPIRSGEAIHLDSLAYDAIEAVLKNIL
jgi:inorganic triphosphatase YgiF